MGWIGPGGDGFCDWCMRDVPACALVMCACKEVIMVHKGHSVLAEARGAPLDEQSVIADGES